MILNIDTEKSIERERLYPKSKFSYYSDFFAYGFFALVFLVIIIGSLRDDNFYFSPTRIFWISIYIIVFSMGFYFLIKMNKLTAINIKDKTTAKQFINSLKTEKNWTTHKENDETIIFQANPRFCNERQVTFIFSRGYILINVMSFGRGIKSPIYYYSDKEMLKDIIEKFNEREINAT